MSEPFLAEIRIVGFNFAPRGWAPCEGQLLPIAQNTALFSLVGTTYGGDGRTTFGLPDLRGRMPMHAGNGPGLSSRRLGDENGSSTVALTTAQIPSHTHTVTANNALSNQSNPANHYLAKGKNVFSSTLTNPVSLGAGAAPQGGGQAHNNQSPYLSMYFVIALQGLYPSRP